MFNVADRKIRQHRWCKRTADSHLDGHTMLGSIGDIFHGMYFASNAIANTETPCHSFIERSCRPPHPQNLCLGVEHSIAVFGI